MFEEKPGCYWYADDPIEYHEYNKKHEKVSDSVVGMEYSTSIPETTATRAETKISGFPGAHSIDQLLVGAHRGESNYKDTIEAGWDVDPRMFGSATQAHFFIFVNPDEYSKKAGHKNCYDCDFIASGEPKYTPGAVLPRASEFRFGVMYRGVCFAGATEGCWWIWAGTQWVGYVPESAWEGQLTEGESEAGAVRNYGEVFDNETDPTTWMGDGQYAKSAGATKMAAPALFLLGPKGEEQEETTCLGRVWTLVKEKEEYLCGANDEATEPAYYSLERVNSKEQEMRFGGPGKDPAPTVNTEGSSVIPPATVEMKGSVDPNNLETHYYFEYGPTTSYGSVSPTEPAGSGVEPVSVNAKITKLKPGTTYHYRLVGHNEDGYGYGADSTFTVPWWFIQSTQNPHGSSETDGFRGVSCWSATACDAVGINTNSEDEIIGLVERWNGSGWEVQSTPKSTGATEDNLESVACRSASECEATGYAEVAEGKHVTLAERWNGTAWAVQSTPTQGNTSNLVSVSCSSASECVASGVSLSSSGKQSALVELWNGKEWKILTTAMLPKEDERSWFESVSCSSSKHCIAVGLAVTTLNGIVPLAESYNGSTWTVQSTPTPENSLEAQLSGVSCSATSACTAVGEYYSSTEKAYRALIERYNGTSWQLQESPSPVGKPAPKESHWSLHAVSCPTASSCTAIGSYAESASARNLLLGEQWNGTSWELALPVDRTGTGVVSDEARAVSCSAALTCTLAGVTAKEKSTTETLAERMWEQ